VARQRVWVLWARTWNNGDTRLYKVTSKRAWQKYVERVKLMHKRLATKTHTFPTYAEALPKYFHESNDINALLKMQELAQPLGVKK
jgi:hypothetical protein